MEKKEKYLMQRPSWGFPSLDDDFWGLEIPAQTGLSVSEDKEHVFIEAQLPGLKPEDIEISFDKGVLWIRGEKKEEEEDKEKKYYHRTSSSFSYRLQVPGEIDEKKEPEARYEDGMIKISFAKALKPQAKKIPIRSK